MSVTQPNQADQRPSPGLMLNLSSNNPFRNRAASPISPTSLSPQEAPPRPVSRNPFLEPNIQPAMASPDKMSFSPDATAPPRSATALTGNAADLFDNLTLNERPSNGRMGPSVRSNTGNLPASSSSRNGSSRGENIPPRGPPSHRPSRSQEEAMRARRHAANGSLNRSRPTGELDIFADPIESPSKKIDPRRVRRNSDSSVISSKLLDSEGEKRRQEKRRRERRAHREAGKDGKDSRSKKPDRKLDVIDKLDVTSIYGTGLFHHDGPFDACNPHRNRQGSRRAPMQAFPKDSLNNILGGGGPLNKRPDHAVFLGNNDDEAFKDYSKGGVGYNGYESYAGRPKPSRLDSGVMSSTAKVEPVHGDETLGLGTSTFLEGAPASRTAMQRRQSETKEPEAGGLGRKKSLAQRIRGVNNTRRDNGPGRVTSPGAISPGANSPEGGWISPDAPAYTPGGTKIEKNPFFNELKEGDKTQTITIQEPEKIGRAQAPRSPQRSVGERLERRVTSDGSSGAEQSSKPSGGGFLSRVKSLKGGPRKPRGEKPLPPSQVIES